ncbi:MAG TPA: hypothetical protein VJP40_02270 [bacterium]|nr:hypothetical protein [bacterium]
MKGPLIKALSLFLLLIPAAFNGCGHGGTEVGNPPGPQVPSAGDPGSEDQGGASPTPSPEANLNLDEPGGGSELALNPEETEL